MMGCVSLVAHPDMAAAMAAISAMRARRHGEICDCFIDIDLKLFERRSHSNQIPTLDFGKASEII